jgi:large subunit ribosomal protein L10
VNVVPREDKTKIIEQLEDMFSQSTSGILSDYRGITTSEMNVLRRKLRESSVQCRVVKNTLAKMAIEKSGKENLSGFLAGPVVAIVSYGDDVTAPIKIFSDFVNTNKLELKVKAGFIGEKVFSAQEIIAISKLPPKDELLGKVVSGFAAPIYGLVNCLSSPMRGLTTVLQGRIQQLEAK